MSVILAVVLLLLTLLLHEAGHVYEQVKRGVEIKSVGIGVPIRHLTLKFHPFWGRMRNVVFTLSPVIVYAYVRLRDGENEKVEKLPYREAATIFGNGVVMNIIFTVFLVAAIYIIEPRIQLTHLGFLNALPVVLRTGVLLAVAALFWFTRKYFSAYLAVPMGIYFVYVVVHMILSYGARTVGGPVAIGHYVANVAGPVQAVLLVANLSLALALFNLIPLYPLDGGLITVLLLRKIHPRLGLVYVNATLWIFLAGFAAIMLNDFKLL